MLAAPRALVESLPAACQVCAAWPSEPVCEDCVRRFSPPRARCRACAARLPDDLGLCGACQTLPGHAALQQCVAAVDYEYPWDGLIARFKFRSEPGWARPFARRLLQVQEALTLLRARPLVVPIPLTTARLGERGYNQSWELVKALRAQCRRDFPDLGFETIATALVRMGEAPDQHSLGREERLRNLCNAFAVHPSHIHRLAGRPVLLVDDVSTTGATLQAAAQALMQANAAGVSALVFARTPSSR